MTSVPPCWASLSQAIAEASLPGNSLPVTTVNSDACPRWVSGMPAYAGAAIGDVIPGTTSKRTPALWSASASSLSCKCGDLLYSWVEQVGKLFLTYLNFLRLTSDFSTKKLIFQGKIITFFRILPTKLDPKVAIGVPNRLLTARNRFYTKNSF